MTARDSALKRDSAGDDGNDLGTGLLDGHQQLNLRRLWALGTLLT
jgi:hypothetical protein